MPLITFIDTFSKPETIWINPLYDECPICHLKIKGIELAYRSNLNKEIVDIAVQCTNQNCSRLFIASYQKSNHTDKNGYQCYTLLCVRPETPVDFEFSEEIKELSPTFVEVYNQSLYSESMLLSQITGIGLRKALEFLIKDYCIYSAPSDHEKIKNSRLAYCIENYVTDSKIKSCANRAAWLGNDETHYVRRWEDKDIRDLKILIKLTVNWVESSIITEKYISEMQENK